MSEESFNSFGWRIPFLFSAILVIASYFIRRRLHESPVFAQLKSEGKTSNSPVKETFKTKKNIGLILGAIFGGNAAQSAIMQTNQFITLFFLLVIISRSVAFEDYLCQPLITSGEKFA
jgi:MFS family permease